MVSPPNVLLVLTNFHAEKGFDSMIGRSYKKATFSSIFEDGICQGRSCSTKY
jgi:hypothetical protein